MKKRICIIAGYAPSILNFRKELVLELAKTCDVYVCVPFKSEVIRTQIEALGVICFDVHMHSENMSPLHNLKYGYMLWRLFKKIKPDVVLSYTIKPVIWGSLAARLAGVKRITSMITGLGYAFTDLLALKRRVINKVVCGLYKCSLYFNHVVFFQNQDDCVLFQNKNILGQTPYMVINGSGVNVSYFDYDVYCPERMTFFMMGRLLKDKGVYEYIEAAKRIKLEHDVDFNLAGWIDDNPTAIKPKELEEWCESGVVRFLGQLDDVRDSLKTTSVFVLPSYREGTPRSVLEAMSIGRPIITTDAPGCRDTVIHGENGYLVPIKDVDQLVACMKKFIDDPALIHQFGKKSREIVVNKYDVHQVNRDIISALDVGD